MLILIFIGILSCTISSQAQTWWKNYQSIPEPQVAQIINQSAHPLLITDSFLSSLSLSYLLEPKAQLQFIVEPNILKLPTGFSDTFLYRPSPELLHRIEKEYMIEPVFDGDIRRFWLWRLTRNS